MKLSIEIKGKISQFWKCFNIFFGKGESCWLQILPDMSKLKKCCKCVFVKIGVFMSLIRRSTIPLRRALLNNCWMPIE